MYIFEQTYIAMQNQFL